MDLAELYKIFKSSSGISTDTRTIQKGNLFFALVGEHFDGNKYIDQAIEKGAICAVTSDPNKRQYPQTFFVFDSLLALQNLAKLHRSSIKATVIGITGSNGKTTTKELVATCLRTSYKTNCTVGNLNNHIGVPLTILATDLEDDFLVLEMGANHIGEIAFLCDIGKPDFGLITSIGKAHLEGFGSIDNILLAKGELYQHIAKEKGKIFYNLSTKLLPKLNDISLALTYNNRVIEFGERRLKLETKESNGFLSFQICENENKEKTIDTQLYGDYNAENIVNALAIAYFLDIPIAKSIKAISKYRPANNRSQIITKGSNTIFLDAYNANPTSMREAVLSFEKITTSPRVLILGEMKEVGLKAKEEHNSFYQSLNTSKYAEIILVGELFNVAEVKENTKFFESVETLASELKIRKFENCQFLIKGSRSNKLENLLPLL